jgi:uncharacterized protein involved in exopolysaccharide biosynthesis
MADTFFGTVTPGDLWRLLWRHKKKIVLCPLAICAVGTLVMLYFPRTYRSQAQVFLRLGRESVGLDPTATTGETISLQQGDRKDEVKSAMEVIKSRGVIAQVVDRLGAEFVLGNGVGQEGAARNWLTQAAAVPLEQLVEWYRSIDPISDRERAIVLVEKHLYVGAERGATLIEIVYEAKTPQLAQAVCDAFVVVYQEEHMRIQRSDESSPFFQEQQDRLRHQLDVALEAVRLAKNEMGLADIDQRRATLESKFSAVEIDRLTTQQQLATSRARTDDLQRQLREVPERLVASKKSVPNVGADLIRDQLYSLEVKSMDLQSRYTEKHPKVRAVNEQLGDARVVMAEQTGARMETTDEINPIHRQLSLELKQEQSTMAGLKARLLALDEQKKAIVADLQSLNASELVIDQLSRDADLARGKFFQYAEKLEQARMDHELQRNDIHNISVVQQASLNERPASPSKPLVAIATLLFAAAGTAVSIGISEWIHAPRPLPAGVARELAGHAATPTAARPRVRRHVVAARSNGEASENGHDAR